MAALGKRRGEPGCADRQADLPAQSHTPPSDPLHSWSGLTLQGVKAVPEQYDCQMVKQSGELPLLPFPCCPTHTRQPLGHANTALRRVRAELMSVLLDQRPSL